jgi:hypothetical protein
MPEPSLWPVRISADHLPDPMPSRQSGRVRVRLGSSRARSATSRSSLTTGLSKRRERQGSRGGDGRTGEVMHARNAQHRAANIAAGLCGKCGQPREQQDRTRCDSCLAKGRADTRKLLENRRRAGLCVVCGEKRNKYTYWCDGCMIRHRQRVRKAGGYKPHRAGKVGRPPRVKDG